MSKTLAEIVDTITDDQLWDIFRAYDKAETDQGGYNEMRKRILAALTAQGVRVVPSEVTESLVMRLIRDGKNMSRNDAEKCDANNLCSLIFVYESILTEMRTHAIGDKMLTSWVDRLDFARGEFLAALTAHDTGGPTP